VNGFLAYVIGVLVFLVGIGVSIGLHEVGHMWPAKKFGARVSKYMIGFGPTIFSRRKGETEYGIKLLPLGGYVAISGMLPPEREGQTQRGPAWLRTMIREARLGQYDIDGDYDQSRAFYRLPALKRMVVMLGGPSMNLILGTVFLAVAFFGIGINQPGTRIEAVLACQEQVVSGAKCDTGSLPTPAISAGLKRGDTVEAVNGQSVSTWNAVRDVLKANPKSAVELKVLRGGQHITVRIQPFLVKVQNTNEVTGEPIMGTDGKPTFVQSPLLGLQMNTVRAPASVQFTGTVMESMLTGTGKMILALPQQMTNLVAAIGGAHRDDTGVVSVVGVGNLAGSIGANDQISLIGKVGIWLTLLGSLNYALFAFNLIPLLPLDGGHVLNAAVDGIRNGIYKALRKPKPAPLDTAKLVPFTMVMWLLLVGMGVLSILADFINPISLK
jgi:membrane-associated protease RseP (regulator of RpoE activity)